MSDVTQLIIIFVGMVVIYWLLWYFAPKSNKERMRECVRAGSLVW